MRKVLAPRQFSGRIWRVFLFGVLPCVVGAQGELNTTPGVALTSESQDLDLGPGTTAPILQFSFGFATDEQVVPGEILDSFTVTLRNPVDTWTVLLATVDAGGAVWLPPTPGTVPINSQNLLWTPIAYPGLTPSLTYQQAYEVTVVLPVSAAGLPLTAHFDLFNNNNALPSQGWYSPVQVIPEPAPLALMLVGGGVLWNRSRRRREGPTGNALTTGRFGPTWLSRLWVWLGLLLVLLGSEGVQAADKTFQLKGSDLTLTEVTSEVAVYYRSMRFNRALNVWNVEVALTNTTARTIQGPLILLVDDYRGTTGLRFFDGEDDSVPAKSFVDLSAEAGDGVLQAGEGTTPRTLTLGSSGSDPPALVTKVYAARRAVVPALGLTRTLDEAGRPLPRVAVTVSGPAGSVEQTSDSTSGVLAFGQGEGENRLRFAAEGFLPVWRRQELTSNQLALAPNPQLPRRSAQTFAVTPLGGTTLSNAAGTISLELGAGAVSQSATVVLTPLTGQTLPAFLPLGWSPLSAFWLESSGPLSGVLTGSLRPAGPIRTSETAALVRWNDAGWRWEVVQVRPGQGTNAVPVEVPGVGAYALVVADTGPLAPPPAVVNQPLFGSTSVNPTVNDLTATGAVVPSASPASEDPDAVTGTAQLEIRHAEAPLPSGYLLRGEVTETYVLRDGSLRLTPQYEHFIVGYQRPGDQDPNTLQAQFAVRPQLLFGTDQLDSASVKVDVLPTQPFDGQVIETAGGQIGTSGIRILAGSGRLTAPSPMRLWRLDGTIFQPLMSPGHSVVAAFELTLDGSTVTRSLATQIQGAPTNSHLVLARVLSETGYYGLQPVERLRSDAQGALTSLEPETGERLPGLRGSGQFVLIQVPTAQALISGVARNGQGAVQALMPVRLLGLPWLALTDRDGRFQLTGPVGAQQLQVTDPRTGDTGLNGITVVDPATAVQQDLTTTPRGPAVARITPAAGATRVPRVGSVVIEFNEAVNPGTVINAIRLVRPDNQVVPTSLSLNLANRIATLSPATDLEANTVYRVLLDPTIADPSGLPLEGTREFSFTTVPASTRIATAQLIIYEPGATNVPPEILANIPAYEPGSDAFSIVVHGQPGVADPEVPVILVNESTGETVTVLSNVDGSFSSLISGTEEDFVSATFVNLNGTRVYVPVSRQEFDDGFVGLYPQGGILEAQSDGGPVQVLIKPGAIPNKAKLRLKRPTATQLAELLGDTVPESAVQLAPPLILEGESQPLGEPMQISFKVNLLSAGYPQDIDPVEAAVALVRITDTDGVKAFEVLDQMVFTSDQANAPVIKGQRTHPGVRPQNLDEQLFFGTVNSVIGLVPQAGIANTVFRYALMPILLGGKPIVVKGRAIQSFEAPQLANPFAVNDPLLKGFNFEQLNRGLRPLDLASQGIGQVNNTVQQLGDLLLGRPLGGAFITLQNVVTGSVPGRIRPGMVYTTSDRNGNFLMVAPTTPFVVISPGDFFLVMATHPKFREKLSEPLLALTDMSIAGVVYKNFVFREPLVLQAPPQVNAAHSPPYPAAGDSVELQVTASQGFQGNPEVNVFVDQVFPADQSISGVIVSNVVRVTDGNRTIWNGLVTATNTIRRVVLRISALPSAGEPKVIRYPISFIGAPQPAGDGLIIPSDPNEKKGPAVAASLPVEGGLVDAAGMVTLSFNEPIDRSVETNLTGVILSPQSPGLATGATLSADQTVLNLYFSGLQPDTDYSLTLSGDSVIDLSGNPLDQRPSTVAPEAFNLNFRTPPVARYELPGLINGAGSAIHGARLYALDNATTPMLRTYDISNPAQPRLLGSARVVGQPRDLVVIPRYRYKLNLHEETRTNDLVAVVGGYLDAVVDDLDTVIVSGQYLRVFEMEDPANPREIASPILSYRVGSTVPKVRWAAPHLVYQEFGADIHQVAFVNLQELLIGWHATRAQQDTFPVSGKEGVDVDSNGDYVGPGESFPLPERRPAEFYGKKKSYLITGSNQRVLDFAVSGGTVGVSLTGGFALTAGGNVDLGRPVFPQYRTLAFNGQDVTAGSVDFAAGDYPGRVTIIDGLPVEDNGRIFTPVVALVSLSPDRQGRHRLVALDISLPESPALIGEIRFPEELSGGQLRSIHLREDGLLELASVSHVFHIDSRRLAMPTPPEDQPGRLHPAVVGYFPYAGGRMRTVGSSPQGIRVLAESGRGEIVQSAPALSFINFPLAPEVVDPRHLIRGEDELRVLMSRAQSAEHLVPARVKGDHLGHKSDLFPANPEVHYHVVVEAPGGAGETIKLGLESLSRAGWPLPNPGAGFPPVRAVDAATLQALNIKLRPDCDAPIRPLLAYRMSHDPSSPYFNRYLSRPFVLVYESMSIDDLETQRLNADREILWSGAGVRVFVEPTEQGNEPIGPFAARVDMPQGVIFPVGDVSAETLDVSYAPGPNPPPPGGDVRLPGTFGSVSAHSGEVRTEAADLALPSPRMPILIQRTIGGQDNYDGPFGLGWDFNYNQRITELQPQLFPEGFKMPLIGRATLENSVVGSSRDLLFHTGAGRIVLFEWRGTNMPPEYVADPLVRELRYAPVAADYFLPEPGVFDLLVKFKDGKYERLTPDGTRYRYAANGRLETIIDRFPANRHELEYDRRGGLRRIDDRSVTGERFVEFGFYRRDNDIEFVEGLDERSANPYLLGKICRVRDYAGRDVLYSYNDEGLLIVREGVEVGGENGGFTGRNQTHYLYKDCRPIGVAVGPNKVPLLVAETQPGEGGAPVSARVDGVGGATATAVPPENVARTLASLETSAVQPDGRTTEYTFTAFGHPSSITVSGPNVPPAVLGLDPNEHGQVRVAIYPEGRVHRMTYDTDNPVFRSRGNLVKLAVEAGSRGGEDYTETYQYDPYYNLPDGAHTDANGFAVTYGLSGDRRSVRSIRYDTAGSVVMDYNEHGQLISRVDQDGLEATLEYQASSGFVQQSTKGIHTTAYGYRGLAGKLGQATTITPPRGAAIQTDYNANLQPVRVTRGQQLQLMAYDGQGRRVLHEELVGDGKRRQTRLTIDELGFVHARRVDGIEVDGAETALEYAYKPDELFRVKEIKHPGGSTQRFFYNALGHQRRMELESYVEEYETDRHGNIQVVKKGGDVVSRMEYDGLDRPKLIVTPTGSVEYRIERSYFPGGQLRSEKVTDPVFGNVREQVVDGIDALGRTLSSTIHGDLVNRTDTIEHGSLVRRTTGPRQTIVEQWSTAGYPTRYLDSLVNATLLTDGNGNIERVLREEDDASFLSVFTYNEIDHRRTASDSFGPIAEFTPRADGLNTAIKNARNNVGTMEHSALGEVLRRRRADGMEFRFRHDEQRQVKYTGDPGDGFEFEYDNLFRLTQRTQRDGAEITNDSFDARNQPTSVTIPGGTIDLTYDLQARVKTSTVKFGSTTYQNRTDYDALNRVRVLNYEQSGGTANTARYSYDKAGPLREARFSEGGSDFVVRYEYRNDLERSRVIYPSGFVVNQDRDNSGRLVRIHGPVEDIVTVAEWHGNRLPRTVSYGGVLQASHRYDSRGRLTGMRYQQTPGSLQAELRFQHDAANNVEMRQFLHRAGKTDNFSYDNGERLVRAQIGGLPLEDGIGVTGFLYQRSYNYEATGLDYLLTAPIAGPVEPAAPFAGTWSGHDAFLLPSTVNDMNRGTPDALGRVTRAQLWVRPVGGTQPVPVMATLQHNGLGQLTRIERADGVVIENFFQPGGLRYARRVTQSGVTVDHRHYVYDDSARLLEEFDRTGATPVVIARYFYMEGDAPCAVDLPNPRGELERHYYIRDDQQSVVAVADRFGVVQERVWYDPFGQPVIEPRDDTAPVIKRVVAGAGGTLIVEMSEPISHIVADSGPQGGIRRFDPLDSDFISQPAGITKFPEAVSGFAPFTAFVFTPDDPLSGTVELRLRPGNLSDDWDNHALAQTVTLNVTGEPGAVLYTAAPVPNTDAGTMTRSRVGSTFLWHGQYFDYDAGLVYLRARFYDPFSGMFLAPDALGYEDSVNLYAGFANNPGTKRDPTGLKNTEWLDELIKNAVYPISDMHLDTTVSRQITRPLTRDEIQAQNRAARVARGKKQIEELKDYYNTTLITQTGNHIGWRIWRFMPGVLFGNKPVARGLCGDQALWTIQELEAEADRRGYKDVVFKTVAKGGSLVFTHASVVMTPSTHQISPDGALPEDSTIIDPTTKTCHSWSDWSNSRIYGIVSPTWAGAEVGQSKWAPTEYSEELQANLERLNESQAAWRRNHPSIYDLMQRDARRPKF